MALLIILLAFMFFASVGPVEIRENLGSWTGLVPFDVWVALIWALVIIVVGIFWGTLSSAEGRRAVARWLGANRD